VINKSDKEKERFDFSGVTTNGTNLKQVVMEYYNRSYPIPKGMGCDTLVKLCKKKAALTIFWGDVYSVTNGKTEFKTIKGETIEKSNQSSLLITRGWEIDCCTGEFKLKFFFQAMKGVQSVSFTEVFSSGGTPCDVLKDCSECKDKCEKDKAMKEAAKKAAGKN